MSFEALMKQLSGLVVFGLAGPEDHHLIFYCHPAPGSYDEMKQGISDCDRFRTLQGSIASLVGWWTHDRMELEKNLLTVSPTPSCFGYGALWRLYSSRAIELYEVRWMHICCPSARDTQTLVVSRVEVTKQG